MGWGGAGKERTNNVEAGSERGMTAVGAAPFSPQTPRLKLMLKASVGACLGVLVLGHSLDMGAKGLLCARWKFRQPRGAGAAGGFAQLSGAAPIPTAKLLNLGFIFPSSTEA